MSDKLKGVGKTLKQTKKEGEHALNRYSENFPKIERTRDVIAAATVNNAARNFEIHFKTKQPDNRILVDLTFLLPWCNCQEDTCN